jgi:hypothetical protein
VVLLQLLVAKPVQEAKALLLGRDGERMSQNGSSEVLANLDPRAGAWPAAGGCWCIPLQYQVCPTHACP